MPNYTNRFSKRNNDTGFGTDAKSYGGRFINRDGSYNLKKQGLSFWQRASIYHQMLNMPRWKFITSLVLFFLLINLLYTLIYVLIGINDFAGFVTTTNWGKIKELYFFSTETFTTVGYGRINPLGDAVNFVASFEAMTGFLSFAIVTGLLYGRFARPKAYLLFSQHALIAPYHDKQGLMFRLVSFKENHNLTNAEVKVNAGLTVLENGQPVSKFYDLALERSRVDSLMMNWTIVHPVDENSPLSGLSLEDMQAADLEIYILVRGFDDVYSTTVLQRTSYTYNEIIFNAKFIPMYHESEDGKMTIVELDKLSDYNKL